MGVNAEYFFVRTDSVERIGCHLRSIIEDAVDCSWSLVSSPFKEGWVDVVGDPALSPEIAKALSSKNGVQMVVCAAVSEFAACWCLSAYKDGVFFGGFRQGDAESPTDTLEEYLSKLTVPFGVWPQLGPEDFYRLVEDGWLETRSD